MPYWQLFYHIVWSTKKREPLLTPSLEPFVYDFVRSKASGLGATVFAVNGTIDHIHLVVTIPPHLAVSTFIGQVKGVSSANVNKLTAVPFLFAWQEEYGVFSFDKKRLPNHVGYVERQKEHHQQGTIIPLFECVDRGAQPPSGGVAL
ncbi:MAG: IS200/IS605 family transposase [Deltaproteobacteria bacterium]|nr:IS200/IS605 family transposase [Deltaproteobacteria bacterium]